MNNRWPGGLIARLSIAIAVAWAPASIPCDAGQLPAAAGRPAGNAALRNFNASNMPDPPAPVAPEVITRGDNGRVVVRATELKTPLRIDGRLDEAVYTTVQSMGGLIQTLPNEGAPVSERTEAWIMCDEDNIYLACRCWDSKPPDQWTANELRRDTNQLRQNDMFGVMLDTFHDRRNGFNFYTNPLGAQADQWITDEGNPNVDWNPVWFVRTGRFEGGWTVEMAIPLKSIRYQSGIDQTWGIQIRRAIRRKNEWAHLTFVPASTGGVTSIFRVSSAATLVGLNLPPASKNMEVKPYGISKLTTDKVKTPQIIDALTANGGVDAKYGITANLTADLTVNTDFAQVEVDEQQVNLTRFALVFPEKRDFFLEGRGTFDFGRGSGSTGGGGSLSPANGPPQLFYTRRIGLGGSGRDTREIPIRAGGRVTGKIGQTSMGVMNMQTGYGSPTEITSDGCAPPFGNCTPSTNFTVLRVRRDILRRSTVGAMFTNRSVSSTVAGANQAYGIDGTFSFFQNVSTSGFYARSESPNLEGDAASYQTKFDYGADRYGLRLDYLNVGTNFNPEVGFVQRKGFDRTFASARFSPRTRGSTRVRRFVFEAGIEYLQNKAGQLESRRQTGRFQTEFQNSDQLTFTVAGNYELLLRPFTVSGVTIPTGGYPFRNATASYSFGQQRPVSGSVGLQVGSYYNGDLTSFTVSGARVALMKQFSIEPGLTINKASLPTGHFTDKQLRTRVDYGFSPRMFLSALVQWSSNDQAFSGNYRFRWEYRPGSEIFLVYTDERDTTLGGFPALRNRALVVKANRLVRF